MPENKKCQFKSEWLKDYTCPEPSLEGSNYCIFHRPDKTEEETPLFKHRISQKLQNKDYDFTGYRFPSGVNFQNQVFEGEVNFSEATFQVNASFADSVFNNNAWFDKSTFEREVYFSGCTFKGNAAFRELTFDRDAHFSQSTFMRVAIFTESTFRGDANFQNSTFQRDANFSQSTFEANANFSESTFREWADFSRSAFMGNVNFKGSSFEGSPAFQRVIFSVDTSAEEVFRIAKTCSQRQGEYSLAGEYYYKERIAKRKQLPWYSPKRWFEYILLDGLCGYGERPLRAIRTGLGALFGLAFLYWKVGHIYPSPELFNQPHTLTFLDALYFSVVTFTTLGFGDWRPDASHWIRYVVMSEAFIGAFLMALFIVTFARRMMR